jgi:recombinational DNA repair ATPase RecF
MGNKVNDRNLTRDSCFMTSQAYNKHAGFGITNTKFRSLYDIALHTAVGTIQLHTVQLYREAPTLRRKFLLLSSW